jgi:putative hemolysin
MFAAMAAKACRRLPHPWTCSNGFVLQPGRRPAHILERMNNTGPMAPRGLSVAWARHGDEVRQAQRLRHAVFADELGARLHTPLAGHDVDRYDDFCEHLLVRHEESGEVVGTYRALTPSQARLAGSSYTDSEFDLAPLAPLRSRMLELGRSCVHPQHRHGAVILALWSALAQFMSHNELDTMIGCASIPLLHGGSAAAAAAAAGAAAAGAGRQAAAPDPRLSAPGCQGARATGLGPAIQHGGPAAAGAAGRPAATVSPERCLCLTRSSGAARWSGCPSG